MTNENPQVVDKRRFTTLAIEEPVPCLRCGHERRFSDNEGGTCEKFVPPFDGPRDNLCGCVCEFPPEPHIAAFSPSSQPSTPTGQKNISMAVGDLSAHEIDVPAEAGPHVGVLVKAQQETYDALFTAPATESVPYPPSQFSPSSSPSNKPGMDFPTAMKQVIKGQRVTRLEWENPDIWLMMFYWGQINPKVPAGKYLSIHHADGAVSPLYIGDGDLLADDWIVVV